ncbi:MAG: hypothetical protein ACQES1_06320 [Bacteroidota bacterium]
MKSELWLSKNQLSNLLLLILFSTAMWALQWFFPVSDIQDLRHMPGLLLHGTSGFDIPQNLAVLLGYPILLFNLFLLFKLNSRFQIIANANFLIAWMYLFISCTDYRFLHFSPGLVSVSLFLVILNILFASIQKRKALKEMYFAGLLLFSAALLNAVIVVFVLFVFIALPMGKNYHWREYANFIFGMITVIILVTGVFYITNSMDTLHHMPGIKAVFPGLKLPDYKVVLHDFIIGIFIITALIHLAGRMGFHKIIVRRYFNVIILLLTVTILTYFFVDMGITFRFYLGIPVSFILTHFVIYTKYNYLKRSFLWFLFIMMVISEVLAVFNTLSQAG